MNSCKIYQLFEEYLYFFNNDGKNKILNLIKKESENLYNFSSALCNMDHTSLESTIMNPKTFNQVPYVQVFLWKQKRGEIKNTYILDYDFSDEDFEYKWFFRQYKALNDYPNIIKLNAFSKNEDEKQLTYENIIEEYLKNYKNNDYLKEEPFYLSNLIISLNMYGEKLKYHNKIDKINEFYEYILKVSDNSWYNIDLTNFTLLTYNLCYCKDKALQNYTYLLKNNTHWLDFMGYLLGIIYFGDKILNDLCEYGYFENYGGKEIFLDLYNYISL